MIPILTKYFSNGLKPPTSSEKRRCHSMILLAYDDEFRILLAFYHNGC